MLDRVLISLTLLAAPTRAEPCPPSVQLTGDAELVATIGEALRGRGIALVASRCPSIAAHVERRDDAIAVAVDADERLVREPLTAAAVIESFARDVATPLLAVRPVAAEPTPVRAVVEAAPATPRLPRGLQAFAGLESALDSDRSGWLGLHAGVCAMVGPICLAARLRTGSLAANSGEATRRQSWETSFGVDVPFVVRGWLVSPGIALGPSGMSTRIGPMQYRTNALRADAHATLSIPMTPQFAFDVHLAANLIQQIHLDEGDEVPAEPWGLVRLGVGLRYGR